jgi:hypothetical protein
MPKKEEVSFIIGPGGTIEGIYKDGLAEDLGAETKEVRRASLIEWEDIKVAKGWTVRSAHNPKLAIRMGFGSPLQLLVSASDVVGNVAVFLSREMALEYEQKFFWELLER